MTRIGSSSPIPVFDHGIIVLEGAHDASTTGVLVRADTFDGRIKQLATSGRP
jgi:hypothetical protein